MRDVSRSSIVAHFRCPRKNYYQYIVRGTGIDSPQVSLNLALGLAFHKGMEIFLGGKGMDPEGAVEAGLAEWDRLVADRKVEGTDKWSEEQIRYTLEETRALGEALIRGWIRVEWPLFTEEYEVLSIEEEAETMLSPTLRMKSRWDFIVRQRSTGAIYVGNWKTTASWEGWPQKWTKDVQLWTESIAAEQKLGLEITGCLMVGAKKGSIKDGVRYSHLLYAYRKFLPDGTVVYSAETERSKGWEKVPVWREKRLGVKEWVEVQMPTEAVQKEFQTTQPIPKNNQIVADWLKQVVKAEEDNAYVLEVGSEEEQLTFFRQNISEFNCKWCAFTKLCFQETTLDAALEDGTYIPRVDHHTPTVEES